MKINFQPSQQHQQQQRQQQMEKKSSLKEAVGQLETNTAQYQNEHNNIHTCS